MAGHRHEFVETYEGLVGLGLDRKTDEATVKVFLQKFSDDQFLNAIIPRMNDQELEGIFNFLDGIMKKHLKEDEYHTLFLKDR